MKRRVLSFGVAATHNLISPLANFGNPVSISDYDAFVLDPAALYNQNWPKSVFERRQRELRDLVTLKGGIVICSLRADRQLVVEQIGAISFYRLLDQIWPQALSFIQRTVRDGEGTQWKLLPNAKGAMTGYFRVLQSNLHFEGFLEAPVAGTGGTVFAVNSVGYPVAIEFAIGGGRLCIVPNARDVPSDRVGAAIVRVVETHFGGPAEIDVPAWATDVSVPGADANDVRLAELEQVR